jgi:hypothetical protein
MYAGIKMELLKTEERRAVEMVEVEIYEDEGVEVLVRLHQRTYSDVLAFARASGRPPQVYLRRMARRVANRIGFDGPVSEIGPRR